MVNAKQIVQRTKDLLAQCADVVWDQALFKGTFTKSATTTSLLQALDRDGETQVELERLDGSPLSLETALSTTNEGDALRILVRPVRTQWAFVARDFDDLLDHFDFSIQQPQIYLISNLAYTNIEEAATKPHSVEIYGRMLKFVSLLRELAEHVEPLKKTFVFIGGKRRLDLNVIYSLHDMKLKPEFYDKFDLAFSEGLHHDVKKTLFTSALSETLQNTPTQERFQILLSNLDLLWQKFYADYQLYVSEFSFENEKEKLEERKREYIVTLNNVISGIQNQILAVPISLVLIGGQMKLIEAKVGTSQYISRLLANTSILGGAIVFAVLMFILTQNQRRTLKTIKQEYTSRQTRYQRELPELFQDLQKAFSDVDQRRSQVEKLLFFVNVVIIVGLVFSGVMFILNLPPARSWIGQNLDAIVLWVRHLSSKLVGV